MKQNILNRALFVCIIFIVVLTIGASTGSAPFITYVKSNSMEPLIKVNDAVFILPAKTLLQTSLKYSAPILK